MQRNNDKIRELTTLALLTALVIILQTLSAFGFLKVGLFNITLTLVPIVVGGILLGPRAGAVLGFVFGLMVCIFSVTGVDAGGLMVFQANPFLGWTMCLLKGVAAGFIPAVVYKVLPKKVPVLDAFIAAILAPVANTGIFLLGMVLFYRPLLELWKSGSAQASDSMLLYVILGLCGINFIIEFVTNAVLSPAIATIVKTVQKDKRLH